MALFKRKSESLEDFFIRVHKQMEKQYLGNLVKANINRDVADAAKLESFLNDIKGISMKSKDPINNAIISTIMNDLQTFDGNKSLRKFMHQPGGKLFEEQISEIMASIAIQAIESSGQVVQDRAKLLKDFTIKFNIGSKQTNIAKINLEDYLNDDIQYILQLAGVKTKQYLEENSDEQRRVIQDKQGKIDIAMREVDVSIDAILNPELKTIYKIMSESTFSLKNYTNWKNELGESLSIGGTNIARVLFSILIDLGCSVDQATSVILKLQYAKQNDKIDDIIDEMCLIYELIGPGQVYADKELALLNNKTVRFFIFNVPESNKVYVRSTKKIILDLIKKDGKVYYQRNGFNGTSRINKAYFDKSYFRDSDWSIKGKP